MKTMTAAVVLLLAVSLPVNAQRRRAAGSPAEAMSIAFVEAGTSDAALTTAGSDAWLDVATVKHEGKVRERSTRIRRQFGVRVLRAGSVAFGSAVITARLDAWDNRVSYRIDGHELTTAPMIVDTHASIGAVTIHTLDIEIPVTAAEGPIAASIQWEVRSE